MPLFVERIEVFFFTLDIVEKLLIVGYSILFFDDFAFSTRGEELNLL